MLQCRKIHKTLYSQKLAWEILIFMTANEAADSNEYFFHNWKPHPLPWYNTRELLYLAKSIIQEFPISFNFLYILWVKHQTINFKWPPEAARTSDIYFWRGVQGLSEQATWLGTSSKNILISNKEKIAPIFWDHVYTFQTIEESSLYRDFESCYKAEKLKKPSIARSWRERFWFLWLEIKQRIRMSIFFKIENPTPFRDITQGRFCI